MWKSGALFLTIAWGASTLACATSARETDYDVAITHLELRPTARGRELASAGPPPSPAAMEPESMLAKVSWGSYWDPGGSVSFFSESTVCVRAPRLIGERISGERYDASTEVGAELIRVDVTGAEVRALEAGLDLKMVLPMLLIGAGDGPAGLAATRVARHAAGQLLAAGAARHVLVATFPGLPANELRLLLVPPADLSRVTDGLPVSLVGPPMRPLPTDLTILLDGPETVQHVMDGLVVEVLRGGDSRVWQAPLEDYTRRDRAWSEALRRHIDAIEHGCRP